MKGTMAGKIKISISLSSEPMNMLGYKARGIKVIDGIKKVTSSDLKEIIFMGPL
jgi:hypothetical protein